MDEGRQDQLNSVRTDCYLPEWVTAGGYKLQGKQRREHGIKVSKGGEMGSIAK